MKLGDRIRSLREKEGLTQKALAQKLDIPHQNLSNYERNFRQPDYETLQKVADYYAVTTDFLLGRSKRSSQDVSIAFYDGPSYEDEDEKEFIEQQLQQYRKMKQRFKDQMNKS
ncbi:negative regulation of the defective prophage PBSX genes [Bacillus sp. JCM 19046]|nr:negative regulation of the defective prophage PBSX genes [Bacillus sp. JCM 19045]GAF19497.1 negative regulation of the defective prophage PBSX genes [Bacillus sp. JCM 19046]